MISKWKKCFLMLLLLISMARMIGMAKSGFSSLFSLFFLCSSASAKDSISKLILAREFDNFWRIYQMMIKLVSLSVDPTLGKMLCKGNVGDVSINWWIFGQRWTQILTLSWFNRLKDGRRRWNLSVGAVSDNGLENGGRKPSLSDWLENCWTRFCADVNFFEDGLATHEAGM